METVTFHPADFKLPGRNYLPTETCFYIPAPVSEEDEQRLTDAADPAG